MKKFFIDLAKYAEYICYSGIANLKAEVSGSFLNWTWWILDPFLHMMVYAFISLVVFGRSEPHFIPFVFVGQAVWKYVNSTVMRSVEMIRKNKSVLRRIYLPKQILLLSNQFGFFVQLLITLGITLVMCILDGVQFTWYVGLDGCEADVSGQPESGSYRRTSYANGRCSAWWSCSGLQRL